MLLLYGVIVIVIVNRVTKYETLLLHRTPNEAISARKISPQHKEEIYSEYMVQRKTPRRFTTPTSIVVRDVSWCGHFLAG